jgi:hypothetical protein
MEELDVVDVAPAQATMGFEAGTVQDEASFQVPTMSPPHAGVFAQLPPSAPEPQPAKNVQRHTPASANSGLLMTRKSQVVDDLYNLPPRVPARVRFQLAPACPLVETLCPS